MIHDVGNLSGLFGPPARVVSTEIWQNGTSISTVLEYAGGFRAVASWVDLPELAGCSRRRWRSTGRGERVIVSFPTGFSIGLPSTVTLHGMEDDGHPWRKDLSWHDNPFKRELLHLRDCILNGAELRTPGRDAVADIALVREIILAGLNGDRGRLSTPASG